MKTLILLLLTTTTILLSGCRAYRGYRDYEEDELIKTDNEKVVSVSYDIYQSGDKIKLSESKEIEFCENREKKKTRVWVYKTNTYDYLLIKDPNFVTVLGAIFAFPIDVTAYPFRLMYSFFVTSGREYYDGESYYASKGRKIWLNINPLFSIFQINLSVDNIHSEIVEKENYTKQKSKREDKVIQDYILVKSKDKKFNVPSNIELCEISKKLFKYPLPIQEETVTLVYKNFEKKFLISSQTELLDQYISNYNHATNASPEICFNQNRELLNNIKELEEFKYISPEHSKKLKQEISNKSIEYGKKYKQEMLKQISIMTPETCFEQKNYLEQEITKIKNVLVDVKQINASLNKKINEYKLLLERKLLDKINKMSPNLCWEKKEELELEIAEFANLAKDTKQLKNSLNKKINEYKKQLLDKINKMSPNLCWEKKEELEQKIEKIAELIGDTKQLKNSLNKKINEYELQVERKFLDKINKMPPNLCWKKKEELEQEVDKIAITPANKQKMLNHLNNTIQNLFDSANRENSWYRKRGKKEDSFHTPFSYILESDRLTYQVSDEKKDQLIGKIVLPVNYDTIGSNAFFLCKHITSIRIPGTIKSIENNAFSYCTNLTKIEIPESVISIGYGTFSNCVNLTNVKLPSKLSIIKESLFFNCKRLSSIKIPNNVTSIERNAFESCEKLKYINIPINVSSIGAAAFKNCKSLKEIIIPSNIKVINVATFLGCTNLESISISNNVSIIDESAFYACIKLKEIQLPDSILFIKNEAFSYCRNLISITIPNKVMTIAEDTFRGCSNLTYVTIPDSVVKIQEGAFAGCYNLSSVSVPSNCQIEENAFPENCTIIRR